MQGLWVAIEGPKFAGKTTLMNHLREDWDHDLGVCHFMKEPDYSDLGCQLKKVLVDNQGKLSPETELMLYSAARFENNLAIKKRLEKGEIVISDRSFWSTLVYQFGVVKKEFISQARATISLGCGGLYPDLIVVLCPPKGVLEDRARNDRSKVDISTSLSVDYQIKRYFSLIEDMPTETLLLMSNAIHENILNIEKSIIRLIEKSEKVANF